MLGAIEDMLARNVDNFNLGNQEFDQNVNTVTFMDGIMQLLGKPELSLSDTLYTPKLAKIFILIIQHDNLTSQPQKCPTALKDLV